MLPLVTQFGLLSAERSFLEAGISCYNQDMIDGSSSEPAKRENYPE
jgi:hypothetical protein